MAWDGIIVIGGICGLLGLFLYVPARWWVRRRLRAAPADSAARLHVTSAGWAFCVLVVGLMLAAVLQPYVAPQSGFAQFLSTGIGMVVFYGAVAVFGGVFAMVLEMCGFTLFRRPNKNRS